MIETETPTVRFKDDRGNDFPNWESVALGELADIKLGKMLDKAKHTSGQLLPYLNNISLRWNDVDTTNLPQMYFKDSELERFGLRAGDVVVCEGGEPGRSAIWDGHLPNLKFQKAIHRVRFKVPYEATLLVLYLQRIVGTNRFEMLFTGGGIKHLTRETFALLKVPKPSVPEQQKIADFLTSVEKRIGQLIQKKALLEDYKKGVMQQLFTKAIRFKDDKGNDFPDWEEKKLGEVCSFIKDGTHGTHPDDNSSNYFLLSAKNVKNGRVVFEDSDRRISEEEFQSIYRNYSLQENDILLSIVGTIGRAAIYQGEKNIAFQRSVAFLRFDSDIASFMYQQFLGEDFQKQLLRKKVVGAQPGIYLGDISSIPILVPHADEQTKIADFLSAIDRKIESVATQITETQTFKRGLLQQMFV